MINLCTEVAFQSLNKHGEELCGDHVELVTPDDSTTVAVLADGLGSGVKASILSILTSKIISTMIAQNMPVENCVSAIAQALPVCSVRQIAYSTFTIIRIVGNRRTEIIQFDNPRVVLLRNGAHYEFPATAQTIEGKTIYTSVLELQQGDTFVAFSDGVEHAGVGKTLNYGWTRKQIIPFLEKLSRRGCTAHTITNVLLSECGELYMGEPGDDATVLTVKVRPRVPVSLVIGPPFDPSDDHKMLGLFFSKAGKHIVCGGTTATLAGRYLGREVSASLPSDQDNGVPPIAHIEGVDLVTEGVITISRVLEHAKDYLAGRLNDNGLMAEQDGASRIAHLLFAEATDIHFFVGKAANPAHQYANQPINFSIKMRLVQELVSNLAQMGKHVNASYF